MKKIDDLSLIINIDEILKEPLVVPFLIHERAITQGAKYIGSGLATIGLTGAGVGIGIVFGAFVYSISKSPELRQELFSSSLLGFALTEAIALFALMMAFIILFS
jgi:F-type H+-transporting ATPase subunit c